MGAYLKEAGILDSYEILSFSFAGNTKLTKIPAQLQPLADSENASIIDIWNKALRDVSLMRHNTIDDWMIITDQVDGNDPAWRKYIRERYGV